MDNDTIFSFLSASIGFTLSALFVYLAINIFRNYKYMWLYVVLGWLISFFCTIGIVCIIAWILGIPLDNL